MIWFILGWTLFVGFVSMLFGFTLGKCSAMRELLDVVDRGLSLAEDELLLAENHIIADNEDEENPFDLPELQQWRDQ